MNDCERIVALNLARIYYGRDGVDHIADLLDEARLLLDELVEAGWRIVRLTPEPYPAHLWVLEEYGDEANIQREAQ